MTTTGRKPKLTQGALRLLRGSTRGKINWICRHRTHDYPERRHAVTVLKHALYRLDGEPAPAIVLTGRSGNGKTFTLNNLGHEHGQAFINPAKTEPRKPMIWPGDPVANHPSYLADEILNRYHGGHSNTEAEPMDRAIEFLSRHSQCELLVLDELWSDPSEEILAYTDRIRSEAGTAIVFTENADETEGHGISLDGGGKRKITRIDLPPWTTGPRLKKLLQTIEQDLPLPERSGLDEELMPHIATLGKNTIGGILKTVQQAAVWAVYTDQPRIRTNHLHEPGWIPTTSPSPAKHMATAQPD